MNSSPEEIYTRKDSLRLKGFDYSWPRIYFVTIVAQDRQAKFLDERGDRHNRFPEEVEK
jgi:hypothetical protein